MSFKNMILMAVLDHAVNEFAPCMCVQSEAVGIRAFKSEVYRAEPGNLLNSNREDFSLYVVGEYDPATGSVITRDPRAVMHGKDLIRYSESMPANVNPDSYGGTTPE